MTDIGKRIKELRNERDLTIEMVVADMNRKFNFDPPYHKSMISRWENQKSEPTLENAKYLSLIKKKRAYHAQKVHDRLPKSTLIIPLLFSD